MRVGVGYSDIPDSGLAGRQAAEQAAYGANAARAGGGETGAAGTASAVGAAGFSGLSSLSGAPDLVLLFCTVRHNQRVLREAVAAVAGESVPIYGGGAAGVITNDAYGYAGDQVGVAFIFLDGVTCDAVTDGGLLFGEDDTGYRLGQRLMRLGVTQATPLMLFYDAIGSNDAADGIQLLMATWILEGLGRSLGFQPNLAGAGLMGDHVGTPSGQFTGAEIREHCAMAFAFGGDIRVDTVIMHGCRPASAYYKVTKAEGPVILEINDKPALTFMDELVGSAIKPEQYPFFLLFGINSGERWGEYDEEKYASRMCLGIDRARGGIVMFEPDMVEGTEFQLMLRSSDLEYMRPRFEAAFAGLNGRKPVFAIYIDCAGRSAGYGGTDVEDAIALQQAVAGRVPVLGIYTGVEIAAIAGTPRGLDLTGVFCLFSQNNNGDTSADGPAGTSADGHVGADLDGPACAPANMTTGALSGTAAVTVAVSGVADTTDAASPAVISVTDTASPAGVSRGLPPDIPVDFLNRLCEQNAAKALALDTQAVALRYELELKRRGFRLLSELAVSLRSTEDFMGMFVRVAQRVNSTLNMQKTVVLLSNGSGTFYPAVLQGFTPAEEDRLKSQRVRLSDETPMLRPVVVHPDERSRFFSQLSEAYALPFFIASPIFLQGETAALLITGRVVEQEPYFTRLGNGDLETVHAITELLGSVLVRLRLQDITVQAETDGLTGLWNRVTFEHMVEAYLAGGAGRSGAFMMIDVDLFKTVNDTYGHIAGDTLLKACAGAMRSVLRDTDLIGRQGGDEFVVFCEGILDGATAEKKAAQISAAWTKVVPDGGTKHITASIGISLCPAHGSTFRELYDKADAALYQAKANGRNCYVLYK